MTNPEWLKIAAQRSGQESWTLGYVFGQYLKQENLSVEQLARELDCPVETLDWLALCRRPDDDERFEEHLRSIEKRFAVDPHRLAVVLRHVEVMEGFSSKGEDGEPHARSFLRAARDRSSDDETNS